MRIVLVLLFLAPILTNGQGGDNNAGAQGSMKYYLMAYEKAEGSSNSILPVLNFVDKLAEKKNSFTREDDFLAYLFQRTHQRFLRHYDVDATFGQLLDDRSYNCLTATALYALLLDNFKFDYKIIETNYHIFLLTQTDQGPVLFETTDPNSGYVNDPKVIEKRIALYKENRIQANAQNKTYYRFKFDLYNEVNLDQMLGLLYYNLSVKSYNEQNLAKAIEQLGNASKLYNSPRIDEFSRIILLTVLEGNYEEPVKQAYLSSIRSFRRVQFNVTASSN
jgi:hypothetical protein